jgi:hypothetical protein
VRKEKTCEVCGETFSAKIDRQKYCSARCQDVRFNRVKRIDSNDSVSAKKVNIYKMVHRKARLFAGTE